MAKIQFNRSFNIARVVSKLVYTILALYVGGTIMSTFGSVMNETESAFYSGLSLIGWTVGAYPKVNATNWYSDCAGTVDAGLTATTGSNCITAVGGTGVLSVIGVIALASVVLEFIKF